MSRLYKQIVLPLLLILACCWGFFFAASASSQEVSKAELTEINQMWENSAHALAEVNCSSCHQDSESKEFIAQPNQESCRSCHEVQVDTFLLGKHGIRIAEGLSPLTPAMAHLPMKEPALNKQMGLSLR